MPEVAASEREKEELRLFREKAKANCVTVAEAFFRILERFKGTSSEGTAGMSFILMDGDSSPSIKLPETRCEITFLSDDRPFKDNVIILVEKNWYTGKIFVPSPEGLGRAGLIRFLDKIFFNYLPWRAILGMKAD